MVSQAKEGLGLLVKKQLPVDSLVKENLPGQDCGCTNSDDGNAGDLSAVCVCVVGKTYLLDARLLAENDCGALDLVCNVAEGEPAAPLRGAETACPINGCVCENSTRHYLVVCQTATSSSQQQPGQLEKEKAAPEKNSVDGFVGNTFPAACGSHRSTST
ncbi:hypothetical protein Bpfe_003301 [Biomphalaria pfeifferi]|uniref:Uncharacterized protein n=1 Tax=Biomphalaria pfeifferi TaxID=112525 RepID=A0AAD8FKE8_BIOPF|nr:hypothetical protein Bpfe_003301 [Biomphalaria pfeifferi]